MTDDQPVPIRPGIVPEFDGEREMAEYLAMMVRDYAQRAGRAPEAVAVVFVSDFGDHDYAYSFCPGEQRRAATCARAAHLLLRRANGD